MTDKYKITQPGGFIPGTEPEDIVRRFEKVPTHIYPTESEGAEYVVNEIINGINNVNEQNENSSSDYDISEKRIFVLGLTTGRSPIGIYRKLLKAYKAGKVSFENVAVFSLDEFYPIEPKERYSRNYRIHEELIDHINIQPENIHLINGTIPLDEVSDFCLEYERKIEQYGGIDLMLLGTGEHGQIGFNEPGSFEKSRTRLVMQSNATRKTQRDFLGISNLPERAITMGIGSILNAKRIILTAWGEQKASVIQSIVEGEMTKSIPASLLQMHDSLEVVIDKGAAEKLTRIRTPWLVGTCNWQPKFIRKAVLWLCEQTQKPVLKLTRQDYMENGLDQLLEVKGDYYSVNIEVFNDLQHTITGWPGGKPNADDSNRPETSTPFPKKVLIFSPHPDDDVISMGGTFLRLVDQGHDVHVAYQTSGNIAVNDDIVLQTIDTIHQCGFGNHVNEIEKLIENKEKGQTEPLELRKIKGAIRRGEARAACRYFNLNPDTNCHFLDLPFYETGGIKKGVLTTRDIDIIVNLLRELRPDRIFAAGDLSDPHGTHRVSIEAVLEAIDVVRYDDWFDGCRLWLYRGAWQEWELDMVDMAVPLSPEEVLKKRHAIYKHLSQKDVVPFPGEDKREFWQRAEERTQHTARMYDDLGLAEYQAIEVFVRLF